MSARRPGDGENTGGGGARRLAAGASHRVEVLQTFATALARAETPGQVSEAVTTGGALAIGACRAAVYLVEAGGRTLGMVVHAGVPEHLRKRLARVTLDARLPICDCTRSRTAIWIDSLAHFAQLYPELCDGAPPPDGSRSFCALPLEIERGVLGVVTFAFAQEQPFEDDERGLLLTLAVLCAQALDRARLYEAERQAKQRLLVLANAGRVFAGALDGDVALTSFLSLMLPALGDFGVLDVVQPNGSVHRTALAPGDPSLEAALVASPHGDLDLAAPGSGGEIHPNVDDAWLDRVSRDAEHAERLRRLAFGSMISTPIATQRGTLGSLHLFFASSGSTHSEADLELAQELARRGAIAIETARLHAAAEEAKLVAEAASRLKEDFLAAVSHELRTPLSSVVGWAHILAARPHDADLLRRGVEVIRRNAQAQARIIDDLVDVSRITGGRLELQFAPVDLVVVLREAIDFFRPAVEAKSIGFQLELREPTVSVLGDRDRLLQIAWNLLSNAVKFTPATGSILVRLQVASGIARIEVEDTGVGIDAAFLPFAFDRFRQQDPSSTRRQGGLGLGLSIVRHLVERHGGTVGVRSDGPGLGSMFWVSLPVSSAEPSPREASGTAAPDEAPPPRLDGTTVLCVDDDPDTLATLLLLLRSRGADARGAASAQEALRLLAEHRPHVLVTDIAMPGEDGTSLLRRAHAMFDETERIPAIALTAFTGEESRRRILEAGFDAHVGKPVAPDAIVRIIAELGRRERSEA